MNDLKHHRTLLRRTHRGHEPSAQQLWATFASRLGAYARATLPRDQAHATDDVVQQVFLTLLGRPRSEIRNVQDPAAWLFRLTRNLALNHARTETRERNRRAAAPELRTTAPQTREHGRVRRALDTLIESHQEILLLRHTCGLTLAQCADLLGVPKSTLASREQAALAQLRTRLEPATKTPADRSATEPASPPVMTEPSHVTQ